MNLKNIYEIRSFDRLDCQTHIRDRCFFNLYNIYQ